MIPLAFSERLLLSTVSSFQANNLIAAANWSQLQTSQNRVEVARGLISDLSRPRGGVLAVCVGLELTVFRQIK
jgi:hypothetical protein